MTERDWNEDAAHENGDYCNLCVHCGNEFIGHKRRVVCKVCSTHPTLNQTLLNAMTFHDGQLDKSGVPYIHHPVRVMLRLGENAPDAEKHAALLHDVVEDTEITLEVLRELGYSEEVLELVDLLTRKESVTHRQYIYSIVGSGNVGAMRIKLADLYDNSSEVRRECIADPDLRKKIDNMVDQRYKPAISLIREVLGDLANEVISEEMEVEIFDLGEIPNVE